MDLTALRAAIDEVSAADPATFSDCASVMDLEGLLAPMGSLMVRAVGAFDAERVWHDDAVSAPICLAAAATCRRTTAVRQVNGWDLLRPGD